MKNPPFSGGCQCGNIRFTLNSEPDSVYTCHCTHCQLQSASAFGISVKVSRNSFQLQSGAPRKFHFKSDSGRAKTAIFCPECGTRIGQSNDDAPEQITLKAGNFDDRTWARPAAHIWLKRAQPWMRELIAADEKTILYEGQPENYDAISTRWKQSRKQFDV